MLSLMKFFAQNHLKYGLAGTGVLFLALLFLHLGGYETALENITFIQIIIFVLYPLLLWYFGIKAKKEERDGNLPLIDGVYEGFKIALVLGLSSPLAFLLYFLIFNLGTILSRNTQGTDFPGFGIIAANMVIQGLLIIILGTIYGAVVALFLRSKPVLQKK